MNIYFLQRAGSGRDGKVDVANAFVVAASSDNQARELASTDAGDEGKEAWLYTASCGVIGISLAAEPAIILRDFNAG